MLDKSSFPVIDKLFNFRPAFPNETLSETVVYRSSSPDATYIDIVNHLADSYKIRTIIDLRSFKEYQTTLRQNGNPVNMRYSTYRLTGSLSKASCISSCPPIENGAAGSNVSRKDVAYTGNKTGPRRFLVSFMGLQHYVDTFWHMKFVHKLVLLWYLVLHFIWSHDYYFQRYACQVYVGPLGLGNQYATMLRTCKANFKAVFQLLSREEIYPVMINCHLGKDRTGIVVAILLDLCQVSHKQIVDNYQESKVHLKPIEENVIRIFVDRDLPASFGGSDPRHMECFLSELYTKYGGSRKYLLSIGVTAKEIDEIIRLNKK